jgi:hypothetical protein
MLVVGDSRNSRDSRDSHSEARLERLAQMCTQRRFSPTGGVGAACGGWGRGGWRTYNSSPAHTHTLTQVRARMGRWMVDRKEITIREELGEGAQGTVRFFVCLSRVSQVSSVS